MMYATNLDERIHGIVLSAGEGKRLESYVQEIIGEPLPKQYVQLIGNHSMIENTFYRAEKLIPPERLLTVVSRQHLLHRRKFADKLAAALELLLSCSPLTRTRGQAYCCR
jgi:mannose-1-phosphate guanylyltransferase